MTEMARATQPGLIGGERRSAAPSKLPHLEGVRGLAAAYVFACHLQKGFPEIGSSTLVKIALNMATEAVIVFYVLSGFVIGLTQERRPLPMGDFLARRGVRILPIYWVAIALSVLAIVVNSEPIPLRTLLGNLFFLQSLQAFVIPCFHTNEALWSLGQEAFFYLCFALVILDRRMMWLWLVQTMVCFCLYPVFIDRTGVLAQYVFHMAFSSIWLLGYFAASTRHRFRVTRATAFVCLGISLIATRLDFMDAYYDIFRIFVFALFLIPMFNRLTSTAATTTREVSIHPIGLIVLWILAATWFWRGDSILLVKSIILGASACVALVGIVPNATDQLLQIVLARFSVLGGFSYALYCLHLPIIHAIRPTGLPILVQIPAIVALSVLLSILLELHLQPRIARWLLPPVKSGGV